MAKQSITEMLFELAQADGGIHASKMQKQEIQRESAELAQTVESKRAALKKLETEIKLSAMHQKEEEERLKEEEKKIVARRKQLTSLGGMRSAKLMEREIDIASRVMQSMEEHSLHTMEELDSLNEQATQLREELASLEKRIDEETPERETKIKSLDKEIAKRIKGRGKLFSKLDNRLQRLYSKVSDHYPGDGVAVAKDGACRRCYRALPPQTYNQLLAGNVLIQCPGCQRILVYENGDDGN